MIKRAHLRQFLAIVAEGNFTRAAARLGLTQPTLSLGIAELERLLCAPLFVRERRRVRLTAAGTRLLGRAERLEREFLAIEALERGSPSTPQAPLQLGTIRSIASTAVGVIAAALAGDGRCVMTEGTDAELRAALGDGRLDVALTLLRPGEESLPATPLWREPYRLLVGAAHPLASQDRVEPAEVAGETMIARRACEHLRETSAFFTARGIRPPFALRSDNDERCLALVAAGLGVTVAPASLVRTGVVALPLVGLDAEREVGILFNRPPAEAVRRALKAVAHPPVR